MKVWVDPDKCRGHALCLTHAPEAFEFTSPFSIFMARKLRHGGPRVRRAPSATRSKPSVQVQATVDVERVAGDESAPIAAQEQRALGDVSR